MSDPETKALLERLDELKCNIEQIGAESRAIIEKTKKTVNQIKRAEETEWPCDGSVLGSYDRHPKGLVGADERTIHAKPRTD